jgi:hypothetical protein
VVISEIDCGRLHTFQTMLFQNHLPQSYQVASGFGEAQYSTILGIQIVFLNVLLVLEKLSIRPFWESKKCRDYAEGDDIFMDFMKQVHVFLNVHIGILPC